MAFKIVKMKEIKSSSLKKIGYFRKSLVVEFLSGETYTFEKVPRKVFDEFLSSTSFGNFFIKNIKQNYVSIKH